MLVSRLLKLKNSLATAAGDTIIDLISSTFRFPTFNEYTEGFIRVREEEAMRPDLISIRLYSLPNYHEALMKYNGISNPFAIERGRILIVPPFRDLDQMLVAPK